MLPDTRFDVPWRRLLLRYLKPDQSLSQVYRAMGWSQSTAYLRRRKCPDLRLREAVLMGMAVKAPDLGRWLLELAKESGMPKVGERIIYHRALYERGQRDSPKCPRCGEKGHRERDCHGRLSREGWLLRVRARANPTAPRRDPMKRKPIAKRRPKRKAASE